MYKTKYIQKSLEARHITGQNIRSLALIKPRKRGYGRFCLARSGPMALSLTSKILFNSDLHRKIQTFRNSARFSILSCSLGLTGRDPQGGTAIKVLCKFLSCNLSKLINIYLLNFIKK